MVKWIKVHDYFETYTWCYFLMDEKTKHGFLVDPGAEAEKIIAVIRENGWTMEKEKIALVGDTIFQGSIGSTQYPGGNQMQLVASIQNRIFRLPIDTRLLSGHSEETTVGLEKKRYGIGA